MATGSAPIEANQPDRADPDPLLHSLGPRHELDGFVMNIELTLISIIQGVALSFLADAAKPIFTEGRWSGLPYLVSGVTLILVVWFRSVLHSFTIIRWPLELGHNVLYVVSTLFEALLLSQLTNPRAWYPLGVLTGLIYWFMYWYELRLYRVRREDSPHPRAAALLEVLEREHRLNLFVLAPAIVGGWAVTALMVRTWPVAFLDGGLHVLLGWVQAAVMIGYLAYAGRFYRGIAGEVLAARAPERNENERAI